MGRRILGWLLTASILLFAALFLLLGLGFHLQLADARGLVAGGTRAEGTVTDLVAAKRSTAYRYSYRYPAAGRQFTAVNRSIPMSEREGLRPGAKVPVWFDPAKPERSTTPAEILELESWPNRVFFPLVAIALLAWGVKRMRGPRKARVP